MEVVAGKFKFPFWNFLKFIIFLVFSIRGTHGYRVGTALGFILSALYEQKTPWLKMSEALGSLSFAVLPHICVDCACSVHKEESPNKMHFLETLAID